MTHPSLPASLASPPASMPVSGLSLARDLALLGAECVVTTPADQVIDGHHGWPVRGPAWQALGARLRAHFADEHAARRRRLALGLGEIDYWLLMLCAAAELHPDVAAALSLIAEDERLQLVTPTAFARLLRAALEVPFAVALCAALPDGAARRLRLVEAADPMPGRPLAQQPLRLPAAELRDLIGGGPEAAVTATGALRREAPARAPALDARLVAGSAQLLAERGLLCVRSPSLRVGRQLALDLCAASGRSALLVGAEEQLPDSAEIVRLWDGLPVIDLHAYCAGKGFPEAWAQRLEAARVGAVLLVPWSAATSDLPTVDLAEVTLADRRRVFALCLDDAETAERLSRRFRLDLVELRTAVSAARDRRRVAPGGDDGSAAAEEATLAAEIMAQGARRMGRLVTRLESSARLADLVCSPALRQQLDDIVGHYRVSPRVYEEWRVAGHSALGRGLACLFAGPPGTGKTFAAQCLAGALGLNLYRIDLSQVVSKYIGETEKALARVFDEAEAGHGVLLFDEADAIFGKRSEVKDAHDRYANVEVGYLLQRLESFDGVAVLTTNLRNNLDPAFVRRLRFVLDFPVPDAGMRRLLWEQSLPARGRWAEGLELDDFVERFPLSGGEIHNIGVAAAHLAAASERGQLTVSQLVRATQRELEKSGHARSRDDFGPLAVHLPGRGVK